MLKIYLVKENFDLTEGRGPMRTIAAFTNQKDAEHYAIKYCRGVMGTKPTILESVEELHVAESLYEMVNIKLTVLREQALRKLSSEEQEALGLRPGRP